eukprot:6794995-Heterocapsa_arctica.AAC.1
MRNAEAAVDHLPGHLKGWIVGRIIISALDTIPGLMAAAPLCSVDGHAVPDDRDPLSLVGRPTTWRP